MQFKKAMWVTNSLRFFGIAVFLIVCSTQTQAQNAPYSQRGLGSPIHPGNVLNQAMGGVSEAYSDGQTINFSNPASYADLRLTTLDVGFNAGYLRTRDQDTSSYSSGFGSLSYLLMGFPLKKQGGWGLVFGLTPETRVHYKINSIDSLSSVHEPVSYIYKGNGGAYKAFVGTAYGIKGLRLGVNAGYLFGSKQLSTQAVYPSDSIGLFNSNSRERTGYGAFFADFGIQVHVKLGKKLGLELGASGGLKTNLNGNRDHLMETFYFSGDPSDQAPKNQDTVLYASNEKGTIVYPGHYGFGFQLHNNGENGSWSLAADYKTTQWSDYSYYGTNGGLQDSRTLRFGIQLVPSTDPITSSYWKLTAYRLGFYSTQGNFQSNNKDVNEYAFSFGLGLPIRNFMRTGQYTLINTAFEFGKRGSDANELNESFIRFSVGFTLSDIWFREKRYQ